MTHGLCIYNVHTEQGVEDTFVTRFSRDSTVFKL